MKFIDKINQKLKGLSGDSKSVLTLVGGTTVAQALNFLFSPIITRQFSPEVFGDLSVFTSITGIVGIIVCLRYELAIVLPQDDDEGFSLFKLSLFFAFIVTTFIGIIFLFDKEIIYSIFRADKLAAYWYYVPLTLLLTGIIQSSNYWLTRTRQFTVLSWNKVVPVIVVNLVSIGLGFAGFLDIGARLFAVLISNIANIVVIARVVVPEFTTKKHVTKYGYKELVKRYKNFLVYDIWGALLNNLSWMIVPILMNAYYGSNAAGQYSIGMRVIQIPASLIGASIGQVFLKNASERKYTKNLYPYTLGITKKLFMYTAPFSIIIMGFGKYIFKIVFGAQWEIAGTYSQILAPWTIFWFVASPISSVNSVLQKQNIRLIIAAINLFTRFFSLYVGKLLQNDRLGLLLFSLSGILVSLASLVSNLYYCKKNDKQQ